MAGLAETMSPGELVNLSGTGYDGYDLLKFYKEAYRLIREEKLDTVALAMDKYGTVLSRFDGIGFSVRTHTNERTGMPYVRLVLKLKNEVEEIEIYGDFQRKERDLAKALPMDIAKGTWMTIPATLSAQPFEAVWEDWTQAVLQIPEPNLDEVAVRPIEAPKNLYAIRLVEPMTKSTLFGRAQYPERQSRVQYTEWEWKSAMLATKNDPDAAAKLLSSS